MKKLTSLGGKLLGNVLSKFSDLIFLSFFIVVLITGCTKDNTEPVSPPATLPSVSIIPSTSLEVSKGATFNFNWRITGDFTKPEISLDGNIFSSLAVGEHSQVMTNTGSYVYLLSCLSIDKVPILVSKSIIVTVKEVAIQTPVIVYFTADPIVVLQGKSVKLKWSAKFALDSTKISAIPATLPRLVIDSVDSLMVVPLESTVYTLTCYNKGKSSSRDVVVTVILPPPSITFNERLKADWSKTDVLYKPKDSTQYASRLKPCEVDDHWKFDHESDTTVGTFEMHQGALRCLAGDELWASGGYFLISNNTQIVIGGLVYDIVLITDTQLILRFDDIGMVGAKYEFVFQKLQKK